METITIRRAWPTSPAMAFGAMSPELWSKYMRITVRYSRMAR